MPVTTLFDGDKFDSVHFDTIIRNSVTIEETETIFDSALYGDTDQFDTINGGVIAVDDLLARVQNLNQTITESNVAVGLGVVVPKQDIFRIISASAVTITDSITGLIETLRDISESISVGLGTITIIRPSSVRHIYDLGAKFDSVIFSTPPFDITISSYEITDTLTRSMATFRTMTESSISVGTGVVARILSATRTLSEPAITIGAGIASRLMSAFRSIVDPTATISDSITAPRSATTTITEALISISDTLSRILSATRTLTESTITVGVGSIARQMSSYRPITESTISIGDLVARSAVLARSILNAVTIGIGTIVAGWGTQRTATAYITTRLANSSITKRTTNAEVAIE